MVEGWGRREGVTEYENITVNSLFPSHQPGARSSTSESAPGARSSTSESASGSPFPEPLL